MYFFKQLLYTLRHIKKLKLMDINEITQTILQNYDESVENFIQVLREIDCDLIYNGPSLKNVILNRKVYSCSIRWRLKRNKIYNTIWPIMFGSKLDMAIRKFHLTEFSSLKNIPNILEYWKDGKQVFETPDIAITCFLINGILKQIPFFITNDSSNVHIVKKSIVRLFRYDSEEKGKQLSMYFDSIEDFKRGDLVIKLNNGAFVKVAEDEESLNEINNFFECPYNVKPKIYFKEVFSRGFQIDNIENKIVISPGYLFYKLFKKTLYLPLKQQNLGAIRQKHVIVTKSIENGDLLHVISKKTVFYKENNLKNKMVNASNQTEVQREIGQNDEVFMEKKTTCYRDVNTQIYPYFPYLSHFAQIEISNKVTLTNILAFNKSFIGYLCIFGTTEGSKVGRNMMLARDNFVSTQENVKKIYKVLNLKEGLDKRYVVVNSACIELTRSCFESINLLHLKRCFRYIECFQVKNFKYINYKVGLLFKKLEDDIWVTSREIGFWMQKLYGFCNIIQLIKFKGYNFVTSYAADLIKYYKHNVYPKNILTLNTLKNAILSNTPEYSLYFFETISAYCKKTARHKPLLEPQNELSKYFVLYLPRLNLMYASFKGSTQEDCIAVHKRVKEFDCYRLYTVKIKFKNPSAKYFHPTKGPPNPAESRSFLGTVTCTNEEISIASQTMHLMIKVIQKNIVEIYFTKPNFQVLNWEVSNTYLFISIRSFHKFSYGDKLCSLHGQKGVASIFDSLPRSKYIKVDIIINPYTLLTRQTLGQVKESEDFGGRDYDLLINSDGKSIPGKAFIGPVQYFPISYWASEHNYIAVNCVTDKITGHPLRGRSRNGGMKTGSMEIFSCMIGNGIAACCEEKLFEHGDRRKHDGEIPIPRSCLLCIEDARCQKCNIIFNSRKCIEDVGNLNDEKNDSNEMGQSEILDRSVDNNSSRNDSEMVDNFNEMAKSSSETDKNDSKRGVDQKGIKRKCSKNGINQIGIKRNRTEIGVNSRGLKRKCSGMNVVCKRTKK